MNRERQLNILLIQSYLGGEETPVLPLGLATLAGVLSEHNVVILDLNIEDGPFKALEDVLNQFEPDVVGISLRNIDSTNKRKVTFYYKYLKPTLKQISTNSGKPKIILGGSGFSMFAEKIMEDAEEVDYGIYLEGEESLPLLLKDLNHPESVKGIYYRHEGKIRFAGNRNYSVIDKMPKPRWDLLKIDKYSCFPDGIGIETKRGCALECVYCPYPFLNGKSYRLKSPSSIVDEIESLRDNYNVKQFTFTDSIFNIPLSHAENICQELIKRNVNIQWLAWFNEKAITEEFILLAKQAGCTNFIFSPDGYSDHVLKKLEKNINKEDIIRTYQLIKEIGDIRVSYNFFKNPPGQTLATAIQILSFLIKAKLELGKERVSFEMNSIRIEPHTSLHEMAIKEGVVAVDADLLFPEYYSNPNTQYIEKGYNLLLRLKGK